jgi:hypothetical protein
MIGMICLPGAGKFGGTYSSQAICARLQSRPPLRQPIGGFFNAIGRKRPPHSFANGFFALLIVSRTGTAPKSSSLRIELTR